MSLDCPSVPSGPPPTFVDGVLLFAPPLLPLVSDDTDDDDSDGLGDAG